MTIDSFFTSGVVAFIGHHIRPKKVQIRWEEAWPIYFWGLIYIFGMFFSDNFIAIPDCFSSYLRHCHWLFFLFYPPTSCSLFPTVDRITANLHNRALLLHSLDRQIFVLFSGLLLTTTHQFVKAGNPSLSSPECCYLFQASFRTHHRQPSPSYAHQCASHPQPRFGLPKLVIPSLFVRGRGSIGFPRAPSPPSDQILVDSRNLGDCRVYPYCQVRSNFISGLELKIIKSSKLMEQDPLCLSTRE